MSTQLKFWVCFLCVLALLLGSGGFPASGDSMLPENKVPASVESKALRLMDGFKKGGFEVSQGYFKLYTNDDCPTSFAEVRTCWGNNPAAPYVLFSVPPWPKEFVDPATDTAYGLNKEGYNTSFRLDPREAIVILGVLPPPAKYFGLQTYLFTNQDKFDTKSVPYRFFANYYPNILDLFFKLVPQNHKRVINFASLSNSINNVVIERQSGSAFGQERVFIVTPDQFMDKTVRKALAKILVEEKDIFTEPIPSNMKLGLNKPSDDFVTIIRYAMPEDGGDDPDDPSTIWSHDLPLLVFRIRDTRPGRQAEPYPPVVLETQTAADELYLKPDLFSLVRAVSERWGQPCSDDECTNNTKRLLRLQLPPINMVGPDCTEIGMNCLGDTQDTTYQYTSDLVLDNDVVYAVAGTLGTQTDNATYVGLGLLATMRQLGFANLSDQDLKDTASGYGAQVNNTDKFFLYYFARDCSDLVGLTDGYCMSISEEMLPDCNDPTSKTCDNLKFSIRDYIRPDTQRGPAPILKLPSVVITLKRK